MDQDRHSLSVWLRRASLALPIGFLALLFAYPVASVLVEGSRLGDRSLTTIVSDADLWRTAWFTLWQAALSTAITLAVGLPAAWLLACTTFRGRQVLRALVLVPFVLPSIVVASAIAVLFEQIDKPRGLLPILTAHTAFNVSIVVRLVGGYWAALDARPGQAAALLGASPFAVLRTVTLPRLRPAIAAAASLVFLFCFTSFGTILILGGARRVTLESEIWRYAVQRTDFASAGVLAGLQIVVVAALVVASSRLERRVAAETRAPVARRASWLDGAAAAPAIALAMTPLTVLIARAFFDDGTPSLRWFRALRGDRRVTQVLGGDAFDALVNSLTTAAVAAAIAAAVALAVIVNREGRTGRMLEGLSLLPVGVSAVTLGFGFLVALDEPPLDLRTSWLLVPLAQALIGLPFVLRATLPALRAIDRNLIYAAQTLGATPLAAWRTVEWPVLRRALASGGVFAFAISLGEFGATSFLARPDRLTAPVAIFRLMSRPGGVLRGSAMALCVLLAGAVVLSALTIERLRPKGSA